jgi:hypothetical protein
MKTEAEGMKRKIKRNQGPISNGRFSLATDG